MYWSLDKQARITMQKSDNPLDADMAMIRIRALEWVQGRIQDLILNNVTRDWPVYIQNRHFKGAPKVSNNISKVILE
jgi:hypothetical protein